MDKEQYDVLKWATVIVLSLDGVIDYIISDNEKYSISLKDKHTITEKYCKNKNVLISSFSDFLSSGNVDMSVIYDVLIWSEKMYCQIFQKEGGNKVYIRDVFSQAKNYMDINFIDAYISLVSSKKRCEVIFSEHIKDKIDDILFDMEKVSMLEKKAFTEKYSIEEMNVIDYLIKRNADFLSYVSTEQNKHIKIKNNIN